MKEKSINRWRVDLENLANNVINTLGNEHFDPEKVLAVLETEYKKQVDAHRKNESNPFPDGSILAVANSLREWSETAKKLY